MNPKSILASKTFWLNVAGVLVTFSGMLPPEYGALATALANIINRFFTTQPVTLTGHAPIRLPGA